MMKHCSNKFLFKLVTRTIATKTILVPHLNPTVQKGIENGDMTPRNHSGRVTVGTSFLPDDLKTSIKTILNDTIIKNLILDADNLCQHLYLRQMPASRNDFQHAADSCASEIYRIKNINSDSDEKKIKRVEKLVTAKVNQSIQERLKAWFPVEYNSYVGKQYLVGRMPAEYAVLNKIFAEIAHRCPNFEPHSLFDFGSGVGTVSWVAKKFWNDSIQEYFNVDSSADMNELAKLLLKGGNEKALIPLMNVYYRQFLPAKVTQKYSLVVISYTLFELPSAEARLETLAKLWNKTENFLVIVDYGNKHGFKMINEAREFLLQADSNSNYSEKCHVFAPCPHDLNCPRVQLHDTPCRFQLPYATLDIGRNMKYQKESFSYVVLSKGERTKESDEWPRVITPTLKRKRHSHCNLCTKEGKLRQIVFTKSRFGKVMYHCGRSSKWGDRLPVDINESEIEKDDSNIEVKDLTARDLEENFNIEEENED